MASTATPAVPLLAVAAAGLAGCGGAPAEAGPPPPPQVTVARPLVRPVLEWDRYTGRLDAVEEVEVRARVSGYLQTVAFEGGQLVEEGELLAVIDPEPFETELARHRAQLEVARAGEKRAAALLAQAEAMRTRAGSAESLAASRLANAQDALATDAIARETVDVRKSELAQATSDVAGAEAAVALANAEIATAAAAVASAEAAVERASLDLSYTRITAPISGRIGDRQVTRGNLIQGGNAAATPLTSIVSLDPIHLYFDANEQEYLKYLRLDEAGTRPSSRRSKNPVYVALVDEEGYPHRGHMDFVDNRVDPETGTIQGRAILRNPDGVLTPGLFATVRLPGSARYEAVLVPDEAVQSDQERRFVLVLDDADTARVVPVTLGPRIDGLRVVRSGLDGSERVVVSGLQRVRPGTPVKPQTRELEWVELEDGLPNDYEPVPEEDWIRIDSPAAEPGAESDAESGSDPGSGR